MKFPEQNEDNFFMFLETNDDYLSQIALKNMQLLGNYTLIFARTYFYSSLLLHVGLSINFPKLVTHNIDIVIVD